MQKDKNEEIFSQIEFEGFGSNNFEEKHFDSPMKTKEMNSNLEIKKNLKEEKYINI